MARKKTNPTIDTHVVDGVRQAGIRYRGEADATYKAKAGWQALLRRENKPEYQWAINLIDMINEANKKTSRTTGT